MSGETTIAPGPGEPLPPGMPRFRRAGELFGPYVLIDRLDKGSNNAFGEVWRAERKSPAQQVAIKFMRADRVRPDLVARFAHAESKALARLRHPFVAQFIDLQFDGDAPYLVMEFVPGKPLAAYCDAARMGPEGRLRLMEKVCEAVHAVHSQNIIHRDLKPQNILVTDGPDGGEPVPKLIDFGLARSENPAAPLSSMVVSQDGFMGTPLYASPEQHQGVRAEEIGRETDIYSLGAVLQELLVGEAPLQRRLDDPSLSPAERERLLRYGERPTMAAVLAAMPGGYTARDGDSLRKDVERILTPYGFRHSHDVCRRGYALGTAVLSAPQLLELVQLLDGVVQQLSDPSKQDLLLDIKERLRRGGLAVEQTAPLRRIANRSIVSAKLVRSDSLAVESQAKRLETAILARQRVQLERYSSAARFEASPGGLRWVWPLQLVFHTIGWYIAYEEELIGQQDGLIRLERLDRLALRHLDRLSSQDPQRRQRSLQRLDSLLQASGGIYFGDDLAAQLAVAGSNATERRRFLDTIRFRCTPAVFAFLREGLQRFPLAATRLSEPLPADRWWRHPQAPHSLAPLPGSSHPYPIEIDLPVWTIARDVDLRRWLFGFGDGVIIEAPAALRLEHCQRGSSVVALYGRE